MFNTPTTLWRSIMCQVQLRCFGGCLAEHKFFISKSLGARSNVHVQRWALTWGWRVESTRLSQARRKGKTSRQEARNPLRYLCSAAYVQPRCARSTTHSGKGAHVECQRKDCLGFQTFILKVVLEPNSLHWKKSSKKRRNGQEWW